MPGFLLLTYNMYTFMYYSCGFSRVLFRVQMLASLLHKQSPRQALFLLALLAASLIILSIPIYPTGSHTDGHFKIAYFGLARRFCFPSCFLCIANHYAMVLSP